MEAEVTDLVLGRSRPCSRSQSRPEGGWERWRGSAGRRHPGAAESTGAGPAGCQPPEWLAHQIAKRNEAQ